MPKTPTERWLDRVCAHLRPGHHREAVRRELAAHLDDRLRILRTQGLREDEAERRAVRDMGDPDELGRALAALYHPLHRFFGWMLTFLAWALAAGLAVYLLLRAVGVL
ncbi:MAG: permease prefix domain 1-containing protein [Butyricicoccus sp.]